ncbi:MAG TPA: hypothetical protein VHF89_04925, partial [Solirubrobacteraceae bacterium]|nr:hypothetical protein [Solirubrobacteraceae bacterium]
MRATSTVLLAVLAALLPAAPARSAELGLNINGAAAGGANYQNFEDLSELRSGWARHFLHWDDFDYQQGWGGYQQMIAEEERRGVKTLIAVKAAGNQPPADPQAFADRMAQIARTLKGVDALQVWSEADEPLFWAGAPQPAAYVDLLKRSYAAVKGVSDALVVFSATVGNNFGFVQAAYEAGAKGHFDVMAVHTDTACLVQPPSFYYREQDGRIGRFAFLGHRGVHDVMQANGDGHKPIWMTEFGWSAAEHVCEFGAGAGQRPAGVGEERQARYLLEAMNCLERDPYVTVAMWFNNRDLSGDGKMQNTYGLRRHDGSPRP